MGQCSFPIVSERRGNEQKLNNFWVTVNWWPGWDWSSLLVLPCMRDCSLLFPRQEHRLERCLQGSSQNLLVSLEYLWEPSKRNPWEPSKRNEGVAGLDAWLAKGVFSKLPASAGSADSPPRSGCRHLLFQPEVWSLQANQGSPLQMNKVWLFWGQKGCARKTRGQAMG